uniref:Uncharacterized protein n=1 Tax=Salvator merianae TaxID=96440 RepID=A0A8D0BJV0_SALMN
MELPLKTVWSLHLATVRIIYKSGLPLLTSVGKLSIEPATLCSPGSTTELQPLADSMDTSMQFSWQRYKSGLPLLTSVEKLSIEPATLCSPGSTTELQTDELHLSAGVPHHSFPPLNLKWRTGLLLLLFPGALLVECFT